MKSQTDVCLMASSRPSAKLAPPISLSHCAHSRIPICTNLGAIARGNMQTQLTGWKSLSIVLDKRRNNRLASRPIEYMLENIFRRCHLLSEERVGSEGLSELGADLHVERKVVR